MTFFIARDEQNSRKKLMEEKICAIALNRIFGFNPAAGNALVSNFGSAEAVFGAGEERLQDVLRGRPELTAAILTEDLAADRAELDKLYDQGLDFIPVTSSDYPSLLKECNDPPLGLYYRSGSPPHMVFETRPAVAIVGTRNMTPYGKYWCTDIVKALAAAARKPVIVSGMAYGTDFTAHSAALGCGLPTIGVLPTGIDDVYPIRHEPLARRMDETPGCALVTDYPPGTNPLAINFIRRNRIIAGLSSAVILTESKIKGGGMITMRFAADYFRDVFALPGRVDDICSQGCNLLIRNKLAEPITDLEDLVSKLGLGFNSRSRASFREAVELKCASVDPDHADAIIDMAMTIKRERGISLNSLTERTGRSFSEVASDAALLETWGLISIDLLQRCSANSV